MLDIFLVLSMSLDISPIQTYNSLKLLYKKRKKTKGLKKTGGYVLK